ncbi:MAG: hypothetical protein K2X08_08110 [Chlamydiales bacterium]|nr:hypothetical protein [Chlamydiales bacterium]
MNNVLNVEKASQSSFFKPETLDNLQLGALKVAKVAVVVLATVAFAVVLGACIGVSLPLFPFSPLLSGAIVIGGPAVAGALIGAAAGRVIAAIDNKAKQILSGRETDADEHGEIVAAKEQKRDIERTVVSGKAEGWRDKAQEYQTKCDVLRQEILKLWGSALKEKQGNVLSLKNLYSNLVMLHTELHEMEGLDQSLLDKANLLFVEAESLLKAPSHGNE